MIFSQLLFSQYIFSVWHLFFFYYIFNSEIYSLNLLHKFFIFSQLLIIQKIRIDYVFSQLLLIQKIRIDYGKEQMSEWLHINYPIRMAVGKTLPRVTAAMRMWRCSVCWILRLVRLNWWTFMLDLVSWYTVSWSVWNKIHHT